MVALFGTTLFVSAFLLFVLQPMAGKALLPLFGGTPAVWNLCLVFFQGMLLAGYGYSHVLTAGTRRHDRPLLWQAGCHLALLATALLLLPSALPQPALEAIAESTARGASLLRILHGLFLWIGLPFIALSATSSLLQGWFGSSSHRHARDPYFLYAASNAGSLVALLAYPLFFEGLLPLRQQYTDWRAGYLALAALLLVCAVWRARRPDRDTDESAAAAPGPTGRQRLRWLLYAFVPSSLMLGVTTYASTDIAAMPLLWVIPLVLYLASFVVVFSQRWRRSRLPARAARALALLAIPCLIGLFLGASHLVGFFLPLNLAFFFLACLVAHGRLADERPAPGHLTQYYFFLAAGGVLGGIFNALAAPMIFSDVLEYPLAMLLACALRPGESERGTFRLRREGWKAPLVTAGITVGVFVGSWLFGKLGLGMPLLLVLALPALVAYRAVRFPIRYALSMAMVFLVARSAVASFSDPVQLRERSYYGTLKVTESKERKLVVFAHGSTVHGLQSSDPAMRREPLSYFAKEGPVGQIFELLRDAPLLDGRALASPARIGVVGLGIGTLAAYARSGEEWHFYELDPGVVRVARDSGYFSFLADSPARSSFTFLTGDARLRLREAPDESFRLLFMDAFSSDSIPAHLVTQEAMRLYWSKLAADGVLVFNITNRYFDFRRLIAALAADSGAEAYVRGFLSEDPRSGKSDCLWAVMARKPGRLAALASDPRWHKLVGDARHAWTDDRYQLLELLRLRSTP